MCPQIQELTMVSSVGKNFANVYVSESFEEVDRTVVTVYLEADGVEYKHFTFVLGKGKTRVTLTELGAGKYNCYAIQFAGDEKAEAKISFEISDSDSVVGMLGEIRDRLDRL